MDPNQNPNNNPNQAPTPYAGEPAIQQPTAPFVQPPAPVQPSPYAAGPTPGSQPYQQPGAPAGENPGQTLGIISIVLIFIFPVAGIIVGAISRSKSKAAGMSPKLGTIGMVVNIILTVLSILATILIFVLAFAAAGNDDTLSSGPYGTSDTSSGIYDSSSSSSSTDTTSSRLKSELASVEKLAEAYKLKAGDYPTSKADFAKYPESTIPSNINVNSAIRTNGSPTYRYCGAGAAQITYLGTTQDDIRIIALGSASPSTAC